MRSSSRAPRRSRYKAGLHAPTAQPRAAADEGGCLAYVTVGARRRDRLETLVESLRAGGAAGAVALDLDVTDEASVAAALREASAAQPIDVLINNAGISEGRPAIDLDNALFDAVIDTNLRGVWLMSQGAAKLWRDG
jgi:NAD(P)-dependent dehydrogenase (short-subunit alcohol dehydrogenase family)